ncbi:MAG: glycosyltransferase family 2 protein [Deltaproteobacteria bacterium]|nr:MAG: glycosyltransferase family 2 protein [Deltaproteobacteria bacterium]
MPREAVSAAVIAVVIPCYKVRDQILDVLAGIGDECGAVYVVDDACPEETGKHVEAQCRDPRVRVLRHSENRGVGAATQTGYRQALSDGAEILVKLDGDGQMDPAQIPRLVRPILDARADYTKGNRFYDLDALQQMPRSRLVGNAVLSLVSKLSTGYWGILDPTNGFTALHARVAERLPLPKISERFFFESDLLFRLNVLRAVVCDIPMTPRYGAEKSNLLIRRVIGEFLFKHFANTLKRIAYNYFLRNFSVASLEIAAGLPLLAFGGWIGVTRWLDSLVTGVPATPGTVMLAALPIVLGAQLLLAFLAHDVQDVPREPLHPRLD